MLIFLEESNVNCMNFFKKSKTLIMQLALCSNDIKIYCGWRVTLKDTQPYINLISNYNYFCIYSLLFFIHSYEFDELIKKLCR